MIMDTNGLKSALIERGDWEKSETEVLAIVNDPESDEYFEPVDSLNAATHLQSTLSHLSTHLQGGPPLTLMGVLYELYPLKDTYPIIAGYAEQVIDLSTAFPRPIDLKGNAMYGIAMQSFVAIGRFNAAESNGFLNLGRRTRSLGQKHGFGEFTLENLRSMRNQEAATDLESRLNTAHGACLEWVQSARRGETPATPTDDEITALFISTLAD